MIVPSQPPRRAEAAQTSVSAESNAGVIAAAQPYPAGARGSGTAGAGTQSAAQVEAQRIADARHASARMQLETQDDPSEASPTSPNGPLPSAGPNVAAYGPSYPTRTSPLVAPQSSEFASDTGGDGSHEAPHQAFLARHDGDPGYQAPTSRYELVAGTIIPARLITAIDSTIPGGIIKAQVVEPIFDSATHTVVVIPRGTIVLGQADSAMYGEARLVASWTELYLPNGQKFYAAGNQGAGLKGEAGMPASVDTHSGRAFGSALVGAALQAGVTLASRASTLVDVSSTTTAVQAPQRANPTLHAYPGQLFNIVLNHDLPLDRYAGAE